MPFLKIASITQSEKYSISLPKGQANASYLHATNNKIYFLLPIKTMALIKNRIYLAAKEEFPLFPNNAKFYFLKHKRLSFVFSPQRENFSHLLENEREKCKLHTTSARAMSKFQTVPLSSCRGGSHMTKQTSPLTAGL